MSPRAVGLRIASVEVRIRALLRVVFLFTGVLAIASPALAQTRRPSPLVEAHSGYAGFVDESWIKRAAIGAAARVFVTPRVAVGPEFLYLHGSGGEHDWTLTGNASFDLRRTPSARVMPYLIAGGGLLSQTTNVGTGKYTARDHTFSGGAGARIALGPRFYIAPEFRMGFEPEIRIAGVIGFAR